MSIMFSHIKFRHEVKFTSYVSLGNEHFIRDKDQSYLITNLTPAYNYNLDLNIRTYDIYFKNFTYNSIMKQEARENNTSLNESENI